MSYKPSTSSFLSAPRELLGGLSAAQFMRRHWHKKPLMVRGAMPGVQPPLGRAALFETASRDEVESRLIVRGAQEGDWTMRRGPLARRALPPLSRPRWTLLLQGLDLHDDRARTMLDAFDFLPQARLDDLMLSFATDGGGVGPHVDRYDVFLLQVSGRRRWRVGHQKDLELRPGQPLKILATFEPEHEWLLEPGDMLYLPPGWAHDGVAEGECQTCSIGFRAPTRRELAGEVMRRIADANDEQGDDRGADGERGGRADLRYRDAFQTATESSAEVPAALALFSRDAVRRALADDRALDRALGEFLTEPKDAVWFDAGQPLETGRHLALDRRTRMLYDPHHVFCNGESWVASGADARVLRRLADRRQLSASEWAAASGDVRELLAHWCEAGWAHAVSLRA